MQLDLTERIQNNEIQKKCKLISKFMREASKIIFEFQSKIKIIFEESQVAENISESNKSQNGRKENYFKNFNPQEYNLNSKSYQNFNPKKLYFYTKAKVNDIYLLGDFTEQKWEEKVPLIFNFSTNHYESNCDLNEGAKFNLYVNNSKKILISYKVFSLE